MVDREGPWDHGHPWAMWCKSRTCGQHNGFPKTSFCQMFVYFIVLFQKRLLRDRRCNASDLPCEFLSKPFSGDDHDDPGVQVEMMYRANLAKYQQHPDLQEDRHFEVQVGTCHISCLWKQLNSYDIYIGIYMYLFIYKYIYSYMLYDVCISYFCSFITSKEFAM